MSLLTPRNYFTDVRNLNESFIIKYKRNSLSSDQPCVCVCVYLRSLSGPLDNERFLQMREQLRGSKQITAPSERAREEEKEGGMQETEGETQKGE